MSIGFKEWALVCDALGSGQQSIIIRKGGIAEGRQGFRFQHEEFFLFPTLFHEQTARLKVPATTVLPGTRPDGQIEIRWFARVEWTEDLSDLNVLHRLAPFHLWTEEIINERFRYDDREMVSVAFLRIFALDAPFRFPDAPRYGGCRSWVELPAPDTTSKTVPVLDDAVHQARHREIRAALEMTVPV